MVSDSRHFDLSLESLREIAAWAASCAELVLPLFEETAPSDPRPRAAIQSAREFASGGRRVAQIRLVSLAAHAAAREVGAPAAAAAARAAGLAAAVAYTHPLRDVQQTKHIVGPAAYSLLALEMAGERVETGTVEQILGGVTPAVRKVLAQMPPRDGGRSRLDMLMYRLDAAIRHSS